MSEEGHAAVEFALAVAVLLLPVALVVTAFGPWTERRVFVETAAAEAARAAVLSLDHDQGVDAVEAIAASFAVDRDEVRLGWCGATPQPLWVAGGACPLLRGGVVEVRVETWVPLVRTPWGSVGGLWVGGEHAEPIDLYRSLG